MSLSTARIKKECEDTFKKAGLVFNDYNIKISINGRLTKTYGRCKYGWKAENASVIPAELEFSRQLIETTIDEDVIDIIRHECAHAIACIETGNKQGHNEIFRQICVKVDCTRDGRSSKVQRIVKEDTLYKYALYCSGCGKYIGNRSRSCKVTNHPDQYISNCCGSKLKVIQNW